MDKYSIFMAMKRHGYLKEVLESLRRIEESVFKNLLILKFILFMGMIKELKQIDIF